MRGLARAERLQIMLTPQEVKAIDDWRFEHRMPSRASAVRELLRRGLSAKGFRLTDSRIKSKHFGLAEAPNAKPKPEQ